MKKAQTTTPTADAIEQQTQLARQVLRAEAQAIERIVVGQGFHDAVQLVLDQTQPNLGGAVVVSGVGKSGLIGQKICATFASTGTPSHFLHPTEAVHGDLGRVRREDVVLLLSYGGTTEEVCALASLLKQDDVRTIALVGRADAHLGRLVAVSVPIGDVAEACPLNLAPTASSTAMLALGDALALAVSHRRSFGREQFARVHPGGHLGRQLLPVTEAMRFKVGRNLALIPRAMCVTDALALAASQATGGLRRAGAMLIVNDDQTLAGIFTDGDLVRLLLADPEAIHRPIGSVMIESPRRLGESDLVRDAVQMVRDYRIDEIPVVDAAGRPLGMLDVQDLIALKVIAG